MWRERQRGGILKTTSGADAFGAEPLLRITPSAARPVFRSPSTPHPIRLPSDPLPSPQVLIFANTPDEGMRLRLFLEAFGLRLALLSPDQPLNSRSHILASFNKGLFDFLIAIGGSGIQGLCTPPAARRGRIC